MRHLAMLVCLLCSLGQVFGHSGSMLAADASEPESIFTLEKLTDRAWCLFGRGGNVGFLVTEAGVVVVDDQYEDIAPGIVEQIRTVTDEPILYLVNTHYHGDHTGGNPVFAKFAEIIAHEAVRPRLLEYPLEIQSTFPGKVAALEAEVAAIEDPDDLYRTALTKNLDLLRGFLNRAETFTREAVAPPRLTYRKEMDLWLGDQEIEVFYLTPGHTDGDSMVFFKKEKVLHMGDIFFHRMYPFIDTEAGGSFKGVIENVDHAIARVPPDTKVIPGHGPVTDIPSLRRYRDFLADLYARVQGAVEQGLSKAQAVRTITMEQYPEIKPLFRTLGNNVMAAYEDIEERGK